MPLRTNGHYRLEPLDPGVIRVVTSDKICICECIISDLVHAFYSAPYTVLAADLMTNTRGL